jgi:Domain of unknown function (DUF3786)
MVEARIEAVRRVRERLAGVDLAGAAMRGGLSLCEDGSVAVALLGRAFRIAPECFDIVPMDGGRVSPVDELLALRYLEAERAVKPVGEAITFRELPGGRFYDVALAKRTTDLVVKAFGDGPARLRRALTRYPHDALGLGDVGACVHAIGRVDITLAFHAADDEFPPSAQILYDRIIGSVYTSDEVAALTTNLCVGLLRP